MCGLARGTSIDRDVLLKAIHATFENRGTPLPLNSIEALSPGFVNSHEPQWNAFVRKIGEDGLRGQFGKVVGDLALLARRVFWPAHF